ncbi:MAG: hypothetical protein QM758_23500 [Armatimonas sp.]
MEEKKAVSPAVAIGLVVVALGVIGFMAFRSFSAPAYQPSPGLGGPGGKPSVDGQVGPNGQKGPNGGAFYPTGPQGAMPGQVSGPPTVTGGPSMGRRPGH